MKISARPLKGEAFEVEIDPEGKVGDLKAKIAALKPEFPADQQKLIHLGKILTADDSTIASYNIKEGEFIVVVAAKAKAAPAPAAAPAAAPAPAPAPAAAPPADGAPPAAGGAAPMSIDAAASNLVAGSQMEGTITQLCDMGFPREEVEKALRAAFNNPDRAVEYLMNGIPEGIMAEDAPAGAPPADDSPAGGGGGGGTAPFPAMGGGGGPAPFPAMGGGGGGDAGALGGGPGFEALEQLRNSPQFEQLAQVIASNPQLLAQMLPALQQSHPEVVQAITQNPQAFIAMLQGMSQQGAAGGGMPGAGGGGAPGGQQVIRLTPEESAAIQRLEALGFDRQAALQAYRACDGNEEMAANLLFDTPMDDDQ